MALKERAEGIIITFPVQFLLDIAPPLPTVITPEGGGVYYNTKKDFILAGFKKCIREIEWIRESPDDRWWNHSIGTKPTQDVLYAYIVILGKVRYRANIITWEPGGAKEFNDGRKITAKHWLILGHFIPAPTEIERKGFQGIRYTDKLF